MRVPEAVYQRSSRAFDPSPVELEYPSECLVRKVTTGGAVKIHNMKVPISVALQGWDVGLEPLDGDRMAVWFCRLCIGQIDLETETFQAATQ